MTIGTGHTHKNKAELRQLLTARDAEIARQSAELLARDLLIENSNCNSPTCVGNSLARSPKRWTRSSISLSWHLSKRKQRRNSIIVNQRLLRQKPGSNQRANLCPIIFRAKMSCCLLVRRVSSAAVHCVDLAKMSRRRLSMFLGGSKSSEQCGPSCHAGVARPFIRFQRHPCRSNGDGQVQACWRMCW